MPHDKRKLLATQPERQPGREVDALPTHKNNVALVARVHHDVVVHIFILLTQMSSLTFHTLV